jgi:hypothetical protein
MEGDRAMTTPFVCANILCRAPLGVDHVTLVTTMHVRRFCTVECITEGQRVQREVDAQWALASEAERERS